MIKFASDFVTGWWLSHLFASVVLSFDKETM
jgi:hypothetical protein